jgi:hypothetical protein
LGEREAVDRRAQRQGRSHGGLRQRQLRRLELERRRAAGDALAGAHPELVEPVLPREGHSFVIKARHFRSAVPTDAVAAIHDHLAEAALEMMERNLSVELSSAAEVSL